MSDWRHGVSDAITDGAPLYSRQWSRWKGLYASAEALSGAYPSPSPGWYALVGDALPADIYRADGGKWVATGEKGGEASLYLDELEGGVSSLEGAVGELEEGQKRHGEILKGNAAYIDNGLNYPFVQLGNFATHSSLKEALDALHSTDPSAKAAGYFRATLNGIGMELKSYVTSWSSGAFVQVLIGAVRLNPDDTFSTANEYGTFVRRYSGGSWTKWASATAGLEAAVSGLGWQEGPWRPVGHCDRLWRGWRHLFPGRDVSGRWHGFGVGAA